MSPSVNPAHHIVRSDHRNRLRKARAHRAPRLLPLGARAAQIELERDVIGALEPEDRARLIGRRDLKTQPFDDVARLPNLDGV
jgi:hypothetical protein